MIPNAAEMLVTAEADALIWLERIRGIAENIQQVTCGNESNLAAADARPGDIAFHPKLPNRGPWVIASPSDKRIEMVPVDPDAKAVKFMVGMLQIERAATILRPHG